jgi:hypothetical protein
MELHFRRSSQRIGKHGYESKAGDRMISAESEDRLSRKMNHERTALL